MVKHQGESEDFMGILAECPNCHKKQSVKNKQCKCGVELDKLKRSKKVKYWINYRMPDGKQRRESLSAFEDLNPFSIQDAKDALSKRAVQKKENRIFDMLPESTMSFRELTDWYLGLSKVKKLRSYNRVEIALNRFNEVFGNRIVGDIKNVDLEDYQSKREGQDISPATIDMELSIAQTMVNKAFDNDLVDGHALKAFRRTDRRLKKGSNARERTVSVDEYQRITANAAKHLKDMLLVAYNTGMRTGEVRTLQWSYIDWQSMFIRLPGEVTKEKSIKNIPINHRVKAVLERLKPPLKVVGQGHHDFVFTYRGNPINSPGGMRRSFRTACISAGLPFGDTLNGILFKDFRRSVKTNMVAAGVDKVYRDTILGHSLKGMDVHYIKPTEVDLTSAMDKYTQWIDDQIKKLNVDQAVDQNKKSVFWSTVND